MSDSENSPSTIVDLAISFGINFGIGICVIATFACLRPYFKNVYFPKTYMVEDEKKAPAIKPGLLGWVSNVFNFQDEELLRVGGLDNYMFLRFLRNFFYLFLGFTIVTMIVLVPINVTGGGGSDGLNLLSSSNISEANRDRFWAHLIFTFFFVGVTIYICFFSMQDFVKLRHEFLTNPRYSKTLHARTLFVGSIPEKLINKDSLYKLFNSYPGGVKQITINKYSKSLDEMVKKRDVIHKRLELAETKYITACVKANQKVTRPTHFTGFLGRFGDRVDSIDYYHKELSILNASIQNTRQKDDTFPMLKSAFIIFNKQVAAHMAAQTIVSHRYLKMDPRHIGVRPKDMLWQNLNLQPLELMVRTVLGEALCIALAIFWFIPVLFVSGLSQISKLQTLTGLQWISGLNREFLSFVQSFLPALLISLLNMFVPIIFTQISTYQGLPRKTDVTISVMKKYFWFLIITLLFGSTIFGSIAQVQHVWGEITKDPKAIFIVLSTAIPKNSNFFISYVLLKALNAAAQEILAIVDLLKRQALTLVFVSSPRTRLQLLDMKEMNWGRLWPENTLIFSIGAVYCTIAPISNIFITLYFAIFYFVYKYQVMYVYNNATNETGGLYFVQSIHQVFSGLYFLCIMTVGIMITTTKTSLVIIALILLVITVTAHCMLIHIYKNHIKFLPVDLGLKVDEIDDNNLPLLRDEENVIELMQPQSHPSQLSTDPMLTPLQATNPEFSSSLSSHGLIPPAQKILQPPGKGSKKDLKRYFSHPSFSSPQPVVWIPSDSLGIQDEEATNLKKKPNISSPFPFTDLEVVSHSATVIAPKARLQLREYTYPEQDIDSVSILDIAYTQSDTP
jgi:hypothetical protein